MEGMGMDEMERVAMEMARNLGKAQSIIRTLLGHYGPTLESDLRRAEEFIAEMDAAHGISAR